MDYYSRITDLNILYDAFIKSKKNVDWKCSVQYYESNLVQNIFRLRKQLIEGTYKQKPFFEFDINERGKQRHIKSLHISDRVLQRAICDEILIPELKKYLIYDNGASIKGKGIDFTRNRIKCHLNRYYRKHENKGYILQVDFSKFFDSIPHDILIDKLRIVFDDEKLINLLEQLIGSFGEEKSLGIGSQISQIFGIYYPTPIDNYCKIVQRCKYYGRYMDDLYIIHKDKEFLKEMRDSISKLAKEIGLTVNTKKTRILRIDKGFVFLKQLYMVTETGKIVIKPCKKNTARMRRKLKKWHKKYQSGEMKLDDIINCYKSWRGSIEKLDSYRVIRNMDKLFYSLYHIKV